MFKCNNACCVLSLFPGDDFMLIEVDSIFMMSYFIEPKPGMDPVHVQGISIVISFVCSVTVYPVPFYVKDTHGLDLGLCFSRLAKKSFSNVLRFSVETCHTLMTSIQMINLMTAIFIANTLMYVIQSQTKKVAIYFILV